MAALGLPGAASFDTVRNEIGTTTWTNERLHGVFPILKSLFKNAPCEREHQAS